MKRRVFYGFLIFLFFLSVPLQAFLGDSDPQNFFSLMDKSPLIVRARLGETKPPAEKRRFYLHQIKISDSLSGKADSDSPWVLQEVIFPNDLGIFPKGEFLAFLAPLPNYTAYAAAKSEGAQYRLFGATSAVFPLPEDGSEAILNLVKEYLVNRDSASGPSREDKKKSLLLQGISSSSPRLRNDAAELLGEFSVTSFSSEDASAVLNAASGAGLTDKAKISLVKFLQHAKNAAALEALKKIADGSPSPMKWAAVRALEEMGIARATPKLIEDFQNSDHGQKGAALRLIVAKDDGDAKAFLNQFFSGSDPIDLKREAFQDMLRKSVSDYQGIILEQTQNRNERVAMQAIVALAEVPGEVSLQKILFFLDSPSPNLSSAARMALMLSQDPQANKIYRERFEDKGVSHSH